MEKQNKLVELEKLKNQIDKETDFERVVELFSTAASLVKRTLSVASMARGRITEIIRDLDGYIEKELKLGAEEC